MALKKARLTRKVRVTALLLPVTLALLCWLASVSPSAIVAYASGSDSEETESSQPTSDDTTDASAAGMSSSTESSAAESVDASASEGTSSSDDVSTQAEQALSLRLLGSLPGGEPAPRKK